MKGRQRHWIQIVNQVVKGREQTCYDSVLCLTIHLKFQTGHTQGRRQASLGEAIDIHVEAWLCFSRAH